MCQKILTKLTKIVSWRSVFRLYNQGVMNGTYTKLAFVTALAVSITCFDTHAAEIYHWVDENGVSHFSQQPPDKDTQNVSTKKIDDSPPVAGDQAEDIYNIKAHEERMAEWRKERDQERKDSLERKQQAAQQNQKYQQPESYGPSYWRRPIYARPPLSPPLRPTHLPERPIYNPRPPTASLHRGG